jgi:hypothetical protein
MPTKNTERVRRPGASADHAGVDAFEHARIPLRRKADCPFSRPKLINHTGKL